MLRIVAVIVWAMLAEGAAIAIFLAIAPVALHGADPQLATMTPSTLFAVVLAASAATGACAILLGGRWWTAPIVGAPVLMYGLGVIIPGVWVVWALLLAAVVVPAGLAFVLAHPRRPRIASSP